MNGNFGIIRDIDESILLINPLIAKDGYKFVKIGMDVAEKLFRPLLGMPLAPSPHESILNSNGKLVSQSFFEKFGASSYCSTRLLLPELPNDIHHVFLLKSDDDSDNFGPLDDNFNYCLNLTRKLRLCKESTIEFIHSFFYHESPFRFSTKGGERPYYSYRPFRITQEDVASIEEILECKFYSERYFDLALKQFDLSFQTPYPDINFISLITALECLFNTGKDQIAHTISRHSSVILSNNINEFNANYTSIKKLYHMRSTMVHGGNPGLTSQQMHQKCFETRKIVREALKYVLLKGLKKDDLFTHLNAKGF